jgi:pimeloyl-ACP methyl ester carboxylesterase
MNAQGDPVPTTHSTSLAKTLSFAGNTVAYLMQGQGPAVVIVHGIGGRKEDFAAVASALAPTFTVYSMDMVGFGQSSKDAPSISIGLQVEALRALLAHEKLTHVRLVGNSLGAWVVASFAAANPVSVDRLVLIDAAGLKVTLSGPPPVNFAPDNVAEMRNLLKTVLDSPFAHTEVFAAQALAAFKAGGEAQTLAKLFAGFASPDSKDRPLDDVLPKISSPTLVAWGANDRLFPAALADVVVAGVKGSRKVLIDRSSHFPQIDNPEALSAAIRAFLA